MYLTLAYVLFFFKQKTAYEIFSRDWSSDVCASDLTNAMAEGLNRVIKIVKNRASGFRTLQAFTDMIFQIGRASCRERV